MCGDAHVGCQYSGLVTLLILTARPDLATNRRLVQAAKRQGMNCKVVDATRAIAVLDPVRPQLIVDRSNQLEPKPTAVIARVGNWRPESLLACLECSITAGAYSPNSAEAMRTARDHWCTALRLAQAGVPVPGCLSGMDPDLTARCAAERLGLPVIVKLRRSRMGVGVMLCRTLDHLQSVLDSLWRLGDEFLLQQFVEGGRVSTRALVVGGRIVAAARFEGVGTEFRSNSAQGGAATPIELQGPERELAVNAATAIGLGVCAVDILTGPEGSVVCELNPTPGFIRLEQATGLDVASAIVHFVMAQR